MSAEKIVGVSYSEVKEILRRIGNGEVTPRLKEPGKTWDQTFTGDVVYLADGWSIAVFVDCGDWYYISWVVSPDGRRGEFEDWLGDGVNVKWFQPDDLLYNDDSHCHARMVSSFRKAV